MNALPYKKAHKVLIVDDFPPIRHLFADIKDVFGEGKIDLVFAETVGEAERTLRTSPDIDLVLSDFNLPDGTGGELLRRIAQERPHIRRALMSGIPDNLRNQRHAHHVFNKPFDVDRMVHFLKGGFKTATQ